MFCDLCELGARQDYTVRIQLLLMRTIGNSNVSLTFRVPPNGEEASNNTFRDFAHCIILSR